MATGLSLDWSNFFSTEWSNLHVAISVAIGLSIDNSKNIFFGHLLLFGVVGVLGGGGWVLFGYVFEFFVYFVPVDYVPVCFDEFGSVVFVVDVVCVFEYVY